MRRIAVAPIGVVYYFLIASRLEPSPGDFATDRDYEEEIRKRTTHPVSAKRIMAIADTIDANVEAFARLNPIQLGR